MIIGIAGAKTSGKNTTANFIREYAESQGYDIHEWSFAEDLKKSAAAALGYKDSETAVDFCNSLKEDHTILLEQNGMLVWKISGREYLQWYGTEAHREIFGTNFWVNNLLQKIYDSEDGELIHGEGETKPRFDLITDVRFPNEVEAIRESCGGKVIQIRRTEVEDGNDTHASEKPLDSDLVDSIIYNNFGLDQLKIAAKSAFRELTKSEINTHLKNKVPYA